MCRIAYNPSQSVNFKSEDLLGFFQLLEKTAGKHGNGVYVIKDDRLEKDEKEMPSTDNVKGEFIFHTRIGTSGNNKTYNNQPFNGKRYVLAHNGSSYKMEDYATLLGFINQNKKYSDSYMAHFIVHKVGILNFWLCLKDTTAGVFLIYDKELKQAFLCKFSGVFECGKFKDSEQVIYASSNLKYWSVEEPKDLDNGLYRLNENGFELLDKKIEYSRYARTYNYFDNYESDTTATTTISKKKKKKKKKKYNKTKTEDDLWGKYPYCYYCTSPFEAGERSYMDYGFEICKDCFDQYECKYETDVSGNEIERTDYDSIVSIKRLFNSHPNECSGCKWLFNNSCWFGGTERDDFPAKKIYELGWCHTKNKKLKNIIIHCHECEMPLSLKDEWCIFNGAIMCDKCVLECEEIDMAERKYIDNIFSDCNSCKHADLAITEEPCRACYRERIDETEEPPYWEDLVNCTSCLFYKTGSYPCRPCTNFSNWTNGLEFFGKCWYCGLHFDKDDDAIHDKKGHRICGICDNNDIETIQRFG